jgi:hypothetical protein
MTTIMTMHDDLANRDRDIHWPPGYAAGVLSHVAFGAEGRCMPCRHRMHRGHDLWLATLKWVAEGK